MRILLAHNQYKHRGGEDSVFKAEGDLLRGNGHEVFEFLKSNDDIATAGSLRVAMDAIWAGGVYREIREEIRKIKPDIVHVHNYLARISPAVFHAAHAEGVPVVQTLHNYRLLCLNGMLMRDEAICEDCVSKRFKWPGITNACYRDSRAGSATVASMLAIHDLIGTWRHKVTRFIVLTNFQREKLINAGIPAEKLVVKPNFSADPGIPNDADTARARGLFIGRLSHEKGIDVLVDAAKQCDVAIDLVGSGPKLVAVKAEAPDNLQVHGFVDDSEMQRIKESALFLVLPSIVYEGFPMVIPEAFAMGIPVIAARHGGMKEIIEDGRTGLHFNPADADDLAVKIRWAATHPDEMRTMGRTARSVYEENFSPAQNHNLLVSIYRTAIEEVATMRLSGKNDTAVA